MKKLLFLPSLLALIFGVFSCDQYQIPSFGKWNKKHHTGVFNYNVDVNFFKRNFVDRMSNDTDTNGDSWKLEHKTNDFDNRIVILANTDGVNEDKSKAWRTAKFIIGNFESGELKSAYITSNAYWNEELPATKAINVYIRKKLDKDNFIKNILNVYYNKCDSNNNPTYKESTDNNYIINISVEHPFVKIDEKNSTLRYPYEETIIGTVTSLSEETSFRDWVVKEKGLNLNEMGRSGYSSVRW